MTVEKVVWTTLPYGIADDGRLRVSVHVAPRLRNEDGSDTPRTLDEFPAFANWPDRLFQLKFEVRFLGGSSAEGVPAQAPDAELWKVLFPPKTRVGPHVFQDHAKRDVHVFPVRPVLRFLEQTYGAAAAAGPDLPSIDDPLGPLAPFVPLRGLANRITDCESFFHELDRAQEKQKSDGTVVFDNVADASLPSSAQTAQNALFQAYRFYYRPGSQRPDFPEDYVEPSPAPHQFDFHEMLSSLADHPALLRRLGIVIDLTVDMDPGSVPPQGVVRVVPSGDLPEFPPTCPGTRYDYDYEGRWFGARPHDTFRMARGILRLSPEVYDLFQVDVDGAALQVVGFAGALDTMKDPMLRSEASETETGMPALRSAGLALARIERGEVLLADLKGRRAKNSDVDTGHPVVFDAEDLVRGYRIDVFDENAPGRGSWFSLHRRVAEHTFRAPPGAIAPDPLTVTDEGYLKATSASSESKEHPTPSDDLYLHETVCGWEGWSLSAPRPGKRIVEPGEGEPGAGGDPTSIARYDPEEGNAFPLVSRISVEERSLPRLRVGHTYRMRARTVDLAGNSVRFTRRDLEPPEPTLASEAEAYRRFEPVPSPTVLRRHLDTEGESLEHLVIRSNLGISPGDYANLPEVTQALADAGSPHSYAEDAQRHLAPPKGSEQMAEQDARLDVAFGGPAAARTAALRVALREEGTFLDELIVDLTTGQTTVPQTTIALFPPSATLPVRRGAGLGDGVYSFYPDPDVVLPYLPDPLAIGVCLVGYDFTGAEVVQEFAPFPGTWPTLDTFRLRLSEGPLGAEFTGGVLEVRLPKAEVIWAQLSSVFPDGRLEDLAIWQWIPAADRTEDLRKAAVTGRHWMLTPFRRITFTHAVQQPLVVPDMTKVVSTRSLGDTFAVFRGPVANHAKSTGRLDVFGEWTEDVDLVTDDAPRMRASGTEVAHQAQAFGFEIRRSENQADVLQHQGRHQFGDTKYRRIVYHSVATTRFREFLPPLLTDDPSRIQRVEETTDANGQLKPALEHHILSSARPAAPEVLYVLPTFRWERDDAGPERVHVRRGKAVRIWLRRPWFSSGDGEQLGVILEPGVRLPRGWERLPGIELEARDLARRDPQISFRPLRRIADAVSSAADPAPPELSFTAAARASVSVSSVDLLRFVKQPSAADAHRMLRPYVTGWGSDPVWKSMLPVQPPTVADFPRHTGFAAGLTLEELPASVPVVVAAHDVYFDPARKLWYCDIEINPGQAYFPFVRLAVARYQPHSLNGAHLSRVVMTDFIQVAPDRTARVSVTESAAVVTVQGYSGRNIVADLATAGALSMLPDGPTRGVVPNTTVRVAVERRQAGVPGDLGWERVGPETTLTPTASGFFVTWAGTISLPSATEQGGGYRLVITEVETHLRDLIPGDPGISTSPTDFVRERVVYADTFAI